MPKGLRTMSFLAFSLLARMLLSTCPSIEFNRNRKHGDIEMKELTWKPILSNLRVVLWELDIIHLRLHFLDFGELPEDCLLSGDVSYLAWLKKEGKRHPFDQVDLFLRLEHAYYHLNWAWNCRHTRVWHFTERDGRRWTGFPDTADFKDLWPSDRTVKGHIDELQGKVGSPVRSFVHMAYRKVGVLCYLVAKKLGKEWERPQGLFPEVGALPLTEKDFACRMHRIYMELNMAWNSRRDKTFATDKRAVDRRRLFPSIFATGCHNMWHVN